MDSYLRVGRAAELSRESDRLLYRFFEILPGALSWGTLLGAVLLSWLSPSTAAFFIMAFVLYWLFRTVYFSFHLREGYERMRKNERRDWTAELEGLKTYSVEVDRWSDMWHAVLVLTYKEPLSVLQDSVRSLALADYPNNRMVVALGVEEREGEEGQKKAQALAEEFGDSFAEFVVATHPSGIPGEIAGKGANEAWTAREVKEALDDRNVPLERVIVTSLDADTVVPSQYFSCLTHYYLSVPKPERTSFQPIPLFTNNIWQAGPVSRIFSFASTFWHTMNQERPEKLVTFSTHAMSFQAMVEVGYKQPNVVHDDSRIFWQCFFHYNGDYRVQPIYYPVTMDANAAPSLLATLGNIYRQQRRWAYGAGEIPYFLFGLLKNKEISLRKKAPLAAELLESHWSWATSSLLIFFLGWLPLFLGGEAFGDTLLSYNLPRFVSGVLTVSMIGLVGSAVLSMNLLPSRPPDFGKAKALVFLAQWFLLPVLMIFYTALPALDAQTRLMLGRYMGFWTTPKFRGAKG